MHKCKDNIIEDDDIFDNEVVNILKDIVVEDEEARAKKSLNNSNHSGGINMDTEELETNEEIEEVFNNFKSWINSDEFSDVLAERFYLKLFGQESFDKMKAKQAKKKAKKEAKQARKEDGKETFTDKVFNILNAHKKKTAAAAGLSTCFLMGIVYAVTSK
jgi:hypothetical protein